MRLKLNIDALRDPNAISARNARGLLLTKFEHWKYEQEERIFTELNERDAETSHFFMTFEPHLKLREVVLGAENRTQQPVLIEALGDLQAGVQVKRARLAFKEFKVTNQMDTRLLWRD